MNALPSHGIVASLPTPFAGDGSLDTEALRRLVRFAADAGAAGVLVTALAGEVAELDERERHAVVEVSLEVADARLPVLVGVWGRTAWEASRCARHAERSGAAGVVVPAPADASRHLAGDVARIASATALPALVQDAPGYLGAALGGDGLAEVLRLAPNVVGVKVEGGSEPVELLRERLGQDIPLWSGDGGRHLLDTVRAGAVGSIPGVEIVDRLVAVWREENGGSGDRADAAFTAILPLLVYELESLRRYVVSAKHVLRRRGLLESTSVRVAGARLGAAGACRLEHHLARALSSEKIRA